MADATRRENSLIVDGRYMRCPRCKEVRDILDYQRMGEVEEFREETMPIYKCPKARGGCSWVFAPAAHVREEFLW